VGIKEMACKQKNPDHVENVTDLTKEILQHTGFIPIVKKNSGSTKRAKKQERTKSLFQCCTDFLLGSRTFFHQGTSSSSALWFDQCTPPNQQFHPAEQLKSPTTHHDEGFDRHT
jgi:hypothetical protein